MEEGRNLGDDNALQRRLKEAFECLDEGVSDSVSKTANNLENSTDVVGSRVPSGEDKYIDIEDYCRLVQERGKISSTESSSSLSLSNDSHLDSRLLLSEEQIKLDSQQTPFSVKDFQNRLATYDIMKWSQKPDCISSFQCSRYGWKLTEWGSLACVSCKKILPIPQMSKFYGTDWAIRLRQSIQSTGHLSTCPWTKMPTPSDILSIPKKSDLYSYLCDAASSFKKMKTLPKLNSHYTLIMVDLNLKWLRELVYPVLRNEKEDANSTDTVNETIKNDMALFLVLSGWTMRDTESDDVMSCTLCLRKVPLWLCRSQPPENVTNENSNESLVLSKELDPVSNHWSWCPWTKMILYMAPLARVDNFLGDNNTETNLISPSNDEKVPLKNKAEIYDYQRVLELFQVECSNLSLNFDKQKTGAQLITQVSDLMDHFVSKPNKSMMSIVNKNVDGNPEITNLQNNKKRRHEEISSNDEEISAKRVHREVS